MPEVDDALNVRKIQQQSWFEREEELSEHEAKQLITESEAAWKRRAYQMHAARDLAYNERHMILSLCARMAQALGWNAGIGTDPMADREWRHVVYIDLPAGQISFHIPIEEVKIFWFLKPYRGKWVNLGNYTFPAGDSNRIQVSSKSPVSGYIVADAVRIVRR